MSKHITIPVTLTERFFKGWDAWSIRRGALELVLVPQVGGRIMAVLWRGHDLLFTQAEREGCVFEPNPGGDVAQQKRDLGFPLWGGDKTWVAPQSRWNDGMPHLDLDSGPYRLDVISHGPDCVELKMTSETCRETGLRLIRTVRVLAAQPDFVVRHEMENASDRPVEGELWGVTMVARPGMAYLPTFARSSYPQGVKTYESEGESLRAREDVVRARDGYATVFCRDAIAFKYGVDGPAGWITAVIEQAGGALVAYRKSMPVVPTATYAHGCVAEVYNSDSYRYLELELHGPSVTLLPGERFSIEERHCVADVPRWPQSQAEVLAIAST